MRKAIVACAVLAVLGLTGAAAAADVQMFIRHDVTDYAAWRKGYDAFDAERRGLGVTGAAVYRSIDNPNDITVTHDFKTVEAAKAFARSPRLSEVMKNAGVKGTPQVWFAAAADK